MQVVPSESREMQYRPVSMRQVLSSLSIDRRCDDRIPWYYIDAWELTEVTCLSIDAALLLQCFRMLLQKRAFDKCIKEAVKVGSGAGETDRLATAPPGERDDRREIAYAVISGEVRCSSGKPLKSNTTPGVNGVIRRVSLAERYVSGAVRSWSENERLLSASLECTDFVVRTPTGRDVAVQRPLAAARLSLEMLSDRYEPHRPPFVEILWEIAARFRFVPGGRQQGLHMREEMLREGMTLTAIGQLHSQGDTLQISPPQGKPYVLSGHTYDEIRQQVQNELHFYKVVVALATVVGISLACHLAWRRFQFMQDAGGFQMDLFEICIGTPKEG